MYLNEQHSNQVKATNKSPTKGVTDENYDEGSSSSYLGLAHGRVGARVGSDAR
jgi:hypothetical protein